MTDNSMSRRDLLATLASAVALPLLSQRANAAARTTPDEASALALLEDIANNLLRVSPESATSLGIDTGARAPLRSRLADRSAPGPGAVARRPGPPLLPPQG